MDSPPPEALALWGGAGSLRVIRTTGERGERINYASPEHAGNPHRGRVTEAEREYVRTHLGEVNARLQAQGLRTIDPADSKMQERYGVSANQAA